MSQQKQYDLAIIGDGLAAAMLAWHLHKTTMDMQRVIIFGRTSLGKGKAYGGIHDDLRLNVRDNLMNITLDDGPSFADWAVNAINDPDAVTGAGRFYRRRDFGQFVTHLVADLADARITRINQRAEVLTPRRQGGWSIKTETMETSARQVVLATGNPEPQPPFAVPDQGVITAPWYGDWPDQINTRDRVVIVGSGLTAMDAILILHRMGHDASIDLISPLAVLPPRQADWKPGNAVLWPKINTGSDFIRFWRDHLPDHPWHSTAWQEAFESLRGGLSATWQNMPRSARKSTARRFAQWWQPTRYRAAPHTAAAAEAMLETGQLRLIAGHVTHIAQSGSACLVHRGDGNTIEADKVIMAIGAGRDPFVESLATHNILARDRIGIEVDHNLQVIGHNGKACDGLYAIGPQTAFSRGDIVGASGVSREARLLARNLARHHREPQHG